MSWQKWEKLNTKTENRDVRGLLPEENSLIQVDLSICYWGKLFSEFDFLQSSSPCKSGPKFDPSSSADLLAECEKNKKKFEENYFKNEN